MKKSFIRKTVYGISFINLLVIALVMGAVYFIISFSSSFVTTHIGKLSAQRAFYFTRGFKNQHSNGDILSVQNRNILCATLFTQSRDENYFTVENIVNKSPLKLPYRTGETLKEEGETNYLKKALDQDTYDTEIFSDGALYWHNVYLGFTDNGVRKVAKFQITALEPYLYLKEYRRFDTLIILGTFALCGIAFVVLLYLSTLIYRRIRFFFSTLATAVTKVVAGDSTITISEMDEEIRYVASTFNQLVNELHEKDEQLRDSEKKGIYSTLFRRAVGFLKSKNYVDAEAVLRTLVIVKPDKFAPWFNLGIVYARQRRFTESTEMFQNALRLNPGHKLSRIYLDRVTQAVRFKRDEKIS